MNEEELDAYLVDLLLQGVSDKVMMFNGLFVSIPKSEHILIYTEICSF